MDKETALTILHYVLDYYLDQDRDSETKKEVEEMERFVEDHLA